MALSLGLGTAVAYFLRLEGRWALAAMGAPAGSLLSVYVLQTQNYLYINNHHISTSFIHPIHPPCIPVQTHRRTGLPYLRARALAAPAVLMLMVCEGAYRGAGDTLTPLPIALAIALVNLVLDPLLIFARNAGGELCFFGVGLVWHGMVCLGFAVEP